MSNERQQTGDPQGSTAPHRTGHRELIEGCAVAVGAVALMAARLPIAMRQLWAEDGTIFLQGALDRGAIQAFGVAYAGYLHAVPRLIGAVASLLPLRWAAGVTWALVALVVGWCVATVFVEARAHLRSPWARATLALSLVLLPALGSESLANAANLQFTLLFASVVVIIGSQRGSRAVVNASVLIALTGLSSALAVLLLPLVVWRLLRDRRPDAVVVTWAVAVAIQLTAVVLVGGREATGNALRQIPTVFEAALGGPVLAMMATAAVGAGCWYAWRSGDRARAALLLLVPAVGVGFLVVSAARPVGGLTARYQLMPTWCVVWGVLAALETISRVDGRRWQALVPTTCVALLVIWGTGWQPSAWRGEGRSWVVGIDAAPDCVGSTSVPVMPDAEPPAVTWSVTVDCERLN